MLPSRPCAPLLCCLALLLCSAGAQAQGTTRTTTTATDPAVPCSKHMTPSTWQLLPRQGISCGALKIEFGQARAALRSAMAAAGFVPPQPDRYQDEDDFQSADKTSFIRVRYGAGDTVQDIEFLGGSLAYQGAPLHGGTTFAEVKKRFKAARLQLRDTEWLGDGQDCPELGINIATREDVGGDGDGIEWVILSSTFK